MANIITPDVALKHCKADPADADMLLIYATAAQRRAEMMIGRNFYATKDDLTAAIDASITEGSTALSEYLTANEAAKATYDAAIEAANAITDEDARNRAIFEAEAAYAVAMRNNKAVYEAGVYARERVVYGMVATDDIKAALLLTIGHLFRNREDVVTGQSAPAVEMPNAASNLLWPYTRIRSL